ncbi:hypothetical protein BDV96DRAFT_375790 [Lophiotrema nucula]|uniref:RBR-type E3 ubiquitin transferase n=1 Tax=Lophiotrema nucula TaxID=690887 RepID=A0A6A5YES2_9PLEO|nr:hypothetical protein BDV96DRAFT_375790 [Lophiotrema nucula]
MTISPASNRLALRLQLEDIDAILKGLRDGTSTATIAHEAAVFQSLREDLLRKLAEVNGQCVALALLKEENTNKITYAKLVAEEGQAYDDHRLACQLAGVQPPPRPTLAKVDAPTARPERTQKAPPSPATSKPSALKPTPQTSTKRSAEEDPSELRATQGEDHAKKSKTVSFALPESSTSNKRPAAEDVETLKAANGNDAAKKVKQTIMCYSCLEDFPAADVLKLSCIGDQYTEDHAYCRDCLTTMIQTALADTSHFPPRCCGKIVPMWDAHRFLPKELVARFHEKTDELKTPNRTYCSNGKCAQWIKPANIAAGVGTCTACAQETCATCKAKKHTGLCPEDLSVKQLLQTAKERSWQTCPQCKNMVELSRGCYHITCRCRHEFCYLCQAKWKTCQCDHAAEEHIVDGPINPPAPQNPPAPANLPAPARPAQVNRPAANPRAPVNRAAQAPPAPAQQHNHNNGNNGSGRRCRRGHHEFERLYRNKRNDTECDFCGEDYYYILACDRCDTRCCQYCV